MSTPLRPTRHPCAICGDLHQKGGDLCGHCTSLERAYATPLDPDETLTDGCWRLDPKRHVQVWHGTTKPREKRGRKRKQ